MWTKTLRQTGDTQPSIKTALLSGISGVRGAITLVGVLAVPMLLQNGDAFPERGLMLFIASNVVVLSLVVAVITLPIITKAWTPLQLRGSDLNDDTVDEPADVRHLTEPQAKTFIYQTAVRRLESERREENQKPVLDLISEYQGLIRRLELAADNSDDIPPLVQDEIDLRRVGIEGELATLQQMWTDKQISERTHRRFKRSLEQRLRELTALARHKGRPSIHITFDRFMVLSQHWLNLLRQNGRLKWLYKEQLFAEKELAKGGLKHLSNYLKQPENRKHNYNRQVIYTLIIQYRNRIASVKDLSQHKATVYDHEIQRLRAIAFAAERSAIHDLAEQGYLTTTMAQRLSSSVNFSENATNLTAVEDI